MFLVYPNSYNLPIVEELEGHHMFRESKEEFAHNLNDVRDEVDNNYTIILEEIDDEYVVDNTK